MIDLNSYESECQKKQREIVCQDYGQCKYIANNRQGKDVEKYTVDGNILCDGERCDYLVLNQTDKDAFFIELKGSNIQKAINQVLRTEDMLKNSLAGFEYFYRIVYRTGTHDIKSSRVVNWRKKLGLTKGRERAIIKQMKLEEVL